MPAANNFPKLHNAMWPGLVGRHDGGMRVHRPMLALTAAAAAGLLTLTACASDDPSTTPEADSRK